jgi:hypothetical protein
MPEFILNSVGLAKIIKIYICIINHTTEGTISQVHILEIITIHMEQIITLKKSM